MNNSRSIDSPQTGPHERLTEVVQRHMAHTFKKPIQAHNQEAFEKLQQTVQQHSPKQIILDSCCGTGYSTYLLAKNHPDALVIGVDQSEKRLTKESDHLTQAPDNALYLRANCEDFWRLCQVNNIRFNKHYILYPNPYPKPSQLQRRWHGHAAFSALKDISEHIEVRSNWRTYIEEFSMAWQLLTEKKLPVTEIIDFEPVTFFERKYGESGQQLWGISSDGLFNPASV